MSVALGFLRAWGADSGWAIVRFRPIADVRGRWHPVGMIGGWGKARWVALLLVLASCQRSEEAQQANRISHGPDSRICNTPPPEEAVSTWGACVHRTAYRLASAPEPARDVAEAVVTRCAPPIANQINNARPEEREALGAAILRDAPKFALMYVIEARAGHCAIP